MKSVILDTNVVVSALIQKSYPHYIVYDYVLNERVKLHLSIALLNEYIDVLSRPKFAKIAGFSSNAEIVLGRFEKIAEFYNPKIRLEIIRDKSDNKFLELADESNSNFLITGNNTDFTMSHYKNTQILSPRSFWEMQENS
ncbi:MAG: putative toxin-antitoxin system toxin component, PIN family [Flavobacteriaceae bacterium]|jgi:putative PIN family toxin of toxin-antitoxin system|nr:putative toxin-antitoxin system toxin component, PIN family [Flavobacteriaceae bacterium]